MKIKIIFILLAVTLLTACDSTTSEGGSGSKVTSFNVSPTTVNSGESFTVSMDINIGFDANIRIRESGSTASGSSIYYRTYLQGYDRNITYTYSNDELITGSNSYTTPAGSYEIYVEVCDLEYYLKTDTLPFSDRSFSKVLVIQNTTGEPQNYNFDLGHEAGQNEPFNYTFYNATHGHNPFTIAPGEYGNLTIETSSALIGVENGIVEQKFKIIEGNKETEVYRKNNYYNYS